MEDYCVNCGHWRILRRHSFLCKDCEDDWIDGYDRNGVLGADGNVYSDADPGL